VPAATRRTPHVSRPRIEGERETEILDATLRLLASTGYDRLTLDAVATAAKASKATLYRRWSNKAELVIDALNRAKDSLHVVSEDTGSLRGDLLAMACAKGGFTDEQPMALLAAVITALHHDQDFSDAFQHRFLEPRMRQTRTVFERAKARGEIPSDVDLDLMTPVLAAVLLHRAFILRLPTDEALAARVIDEIVIPAATRRPCSPTTQ